MMAPKKRMEVLFSGQEEKKALKRRKFCAERKRKAENEKKRKEKKLIRKDGQLDFITKRKF